VGGDNKNSEIEYFYVLKVYNRNIDVFMNGLLFAFMGLSLLVND